MKIVFNKHIPFKNFIAFNFFGIIFVRESAKARYQYRKLVIDNHEAIHTAQMKELLYVFFYILYGLNWLFNIIRYWFKAKKAYRMVVFEQEAYEYEEYMQHLTYRSHFYWLKYIFHK